MLTFEDQCNLYQKLSQDYTAEGLEDAKRDINEGGVMFLNRLGRKFNKEYLTTNLIADRQYYQMSSTTLRVSEIQVKQGDMYYTPVFVTSEEQWNALNEVQSTSDQPSHYYIRGFNEIGLYPTPASNVTSGLRVSHEPQHIELTQNDYTTGTVTVTNGSVTVTHSATGFSESMVGRWLHVSDGSDGKWYKIAGFTSTSVVTLENYYEGISGAGRSFKIGEVMKIPNGYHMAPVYYALNIFFDSQNDDKKAAKYEVAFDRKVKSAKETYGRSTSRMGVKTKGAKFRRPPFTDLNKAVPYP